MSQSQESSNTPREKTPDCDGDTSSTDTNADQPYFGLQESERSVKWLPGSWQDGTRKSAFLPYKPTTVLTNLQRGNMPTESCSPEQSDNSFHHRAGQGELTLQDVEQASDVDAVDCNGLSALMWASSYGQVSTVQMLLEHGAKVNREGIDGETSLLLAVANGHHDVIRLLLAEGAIVNHADHFGNTALMFAAYGDHPHCANELLLHNANLTMTNMCGDTAFGIAVSKGSCLVQALIENHLLALVNPL